MLSHTHCNTKICLADERHSEVSTASLFFCVPFKYAVMEIPDSEKCVTPKVRSTHKVMLVIFLVPSFDTHPDCRTRLSKEQLTHNSSHFPVDTLSQSNRITAPPPPKYDSSICYFILMNCVNPDSCWCSRGDWGVHKSVDLLLLYCRTHITQKSIIPAALIL
jgi:hypothetical protein